MMENEAAKELLLKYQQGKCTEAEKALLERWYLQYNEQEINLDPGRIEELLEEVFASLPNHDKRSFKGIGLWQILSAIAAMMIIAFGLFTYYQIQKEPAPTLAYGNDIIPGSNKAILTLANGKKINLSDALNGQVATQAGLNIRKTANGQLTYRVADGGKRMVNSKFDNITTPTGGQWQVVLPDGTKIWLNAASSLTYPASFVNLQTRSVELSGEAYFEVAKDKAHPFIVKTDQQQVEVLGTHFNINSYADEPATTTSLLEGLVTVSVSHSQTIKLLVPGQQASLSGKSLTISDANLEEATAWKNGYFRFNDENIQSIMRKLSRWYNIDVQYQGNIPAEGLNGKISRYKNISQVLKALESTQIVHFKITGRRIIVMK